MRQNYMIRKMLVLLAVVALPSISMAQQSSPGEVTASKSNALGNRSRSDKRWEKTGIFGGYTPAQEVLEKRNRTTKHFLNGDGTTTAQIMPGGIHYQDANGAWQDIDMSVTINPQGNNPYKYVNLTNEVKSFFPGTAGMAPMKLEAAPHLSFEWWQNPKYYHRDGNIVRTYAAQAQQAAISSDGKSLTYPGIYPGITEEFVVVNGGVENNTIIHSLSPDIAALSANGQVEFSQFVPLKSGWEVRNSNDLVQNGNFEAGRFSIHIPSSEPAINFGDIIVFDNTLHQEEVVNILALPAEKRTAQQQLLLDKHVYRGTYKVSFVQGGIEVISHVPAAWLKAQGRAFPVTIDPTVTIGTTTGGSTTYCTLVHLYGYQRNAELYLQSEVGVYGTITAIEYYKNNTSATRTKPTKVWMRSTTATTLTPNPGLPWNSTTYTGGLSTLFDGNTTQDNTTGWKMITLTTPFSYTADNLLIMVKSDYGGSGSSQGIAGNQSISNRSAALNQDNTDPPETGLAYTNGTLYKLSDIRITYTTTTVTCAAPTVPTATSITATTASLDWAQTGTPPQWQIKYGATGFNPATAGTSIFTATKPYTLNPPLTPATGYSYFVRAVCGANDTSAWSPITNFTTLATPVTCAAPTAPTATAITATTASLDWAQTGTPPQWQIKYGATGFNPATAGTSIFTATKPYTLNPPLTPTTGYSYFVRAVCGANDTSAWSPITNFTTLCQAPTIVSQVDSFRCGPGTVVLKATASAGGSIKWYAALTGGTALNTGNSFTTPSLAANTTYYIAAASGTCESSPRQAVVASVRPIPTVNIGNDTTICPGITYNFNAGNTGSSYAWNTGATTQSINVNTPGTYSVLVTTNGCSGSDAINVTQGIAPINVLPATTNLCAEETATLNAGNAGSTFTWTPGGATTQTINVTAGGTYTASIRSIHGCILNSSTNVVIRPLPVPSLGNDTSICAGAAILLDAGNTGYSYLWDNNATSQTITVSDSGTYTVTITTPYNCTLTEDKHIAFLPSPRVEGFNFIPLFYEDLGKVRFSPLNPLNVDSYEWDFGDGSDHSTQVNPMHVYAATGWYTVTLKVFNGCTDFSISLPINVDLTTGIVTLDKNAAEVVLYPNPSRDYITIDNKSDHIKMEEVMVFNTLGAVVYTQKSAGAKQHRLSVSNLAAGIYTVRVLTDKGFVIRKFEVLR